MNTRPIVPEDCKGYALLGSGSYLIHSTDDFHPDLGAELIITFATEEDKIGGREVGEQRATTDFETIKPEEMVIRIGFKSERALFALEEQLMQIRKKHFPSTVS